MQTFWQTLSKFRCMLDCPLQVCTAITNAVSGKWRTDGFYHISVSLEANPVVPLSSCVMDIYGQGRGNRKTSEGWVRTTFDGWLVLSAVYLPTDRRSSKVSQSGKKTTGSSRPDQVETQHLPVGPQRQGQCWDVADQMLWFHCSLFSSSSYRRRVCLPFYCDESGLSLRRCSVQTAVPICGFCCYSCGDAPIKASQITW